MASRKLLGLVGVIGVVALAGCGSSSTSAGSAGSSSSSAAASTGSASAVASSTGSKALVKTGPANVKGKTETVLATSSGMTLYYFTPDTATTSACNGKCAAIWPALTTAGSTINISGIPGTFAVVKDSHGNQISYNGHLLYTYAKDTAPGQANGQGVLGKWFVVTPQS